MIYPPDVDEVAPVALDGCAETPCDIQPESGWFLASVMIEDPVMASLIAPSGGDQDTALS